MSDDERSGACCCRCKFYWHVFDNYGACCIISGSDRSLVKVDAKPCGKLEERRAYHGGYIQEEEQ